MTSSTDVTACGHSKLSGWPLFAGIGLLVLVAVVAFIVLRPGKSNLERLNDDVQSLNQALERAQTELGAYQAAEADALNWRATYAEESENDPTIMGIVDGHVAEGQQYAATARDNLSKTGESRTEYAEYSEAEHQTVKATRDLAVEAARSARLGVEEMQAVPALADDVLSTYIRTFLWFEVDSWWASESADYPNGMACYYGELVSTVSPDGTIQETIVDDGQAESWKTFTVEDYEEFVRLGIVPPMAETNPDREDVGRYLCGGSPQAGVYGALGEPEITLVKERGQLALAQEDENAMVGNYQYGAWCVPGADGQHEALPEPESADQIPDTADWCWHMPQGEDPRYYYHGHYGNGIWTYSRGPRRCYDCNAGSWTGTTLVPSTQMAQATGSDVPNVRGAAQDGGPGTGK
jgi:hypothetical protein